MFITHELRNTRIFSRVTKFLINTSSYDFLKVNPLVKANCWGGSVIILTRLSAAQIGIIFSKAAAKFYRYYLLIHSLMTAIESRNVYVYPGMGFKPLKYNLFSTDKVVGYIFHDTKGWSTIRSCSHTSTFNVTFNRLCYPPVLLPNEYSGSIPADEAIGTRNSPLIFIWRRGSMPPTYLWYGAYLSVGTT
jgi:hypothetical protein